MPTPFTQRVIELIRAVPSGKVATYGGIARMAGSPRAARQVVRVLHSSSSREGLPWHRIINREGRISLKPMFGYERQKELLEAEGVVFDDSAGGNTDDETVDLERFLWRPDADSLSEILREIEDD